MFRWQYTVLLLVILAACGQEPIVIPTAIDLNVISTDSAATSQAQMQTAAAFATPTREPLPPTWTPTNPPTDAPIEAAAADQSLVSPTETPLPAAGTIYYVFNGDTIAYTSPDGNRQGVLPVPQTGSRIADLTGTPDGQTLFYVGQSATNTREIFRADSTGAVTQITRLGYRRIFLPTIRPDGMMLAFFASPNPEGPLDVYVATIEGNGVRLVAQTTRAVQNSLTWGEGSSNRLYYTDESVYAVDTDTNTRYQLTAPDAIGAFFGVLHHPVEPILFVIRNEPVVDTGYFGAFIYRISTQTLTDLPERAIDSRPSSIEALRWGGTGELMLLIGTGRLTVREWAGGRLTEVVDGGRVLSSAVASPDARMIAYVDEQGGAQQVFAVPRDASSPAAQLTTHTTSQIANLVWLTN